MEDKHSTNHNKHNLLLSGPFNTTSQPWYKPSSSVCQRLTGFVAISCCRFFSTTRTLKWTAKSPRLPRRQWGDKWSMQILHFASPLLHSGAISSHVCLVHWGYIYFFSTVIKSPLYMLILKVCCFLKSRTLIVPVTLLSTTYNNWWKWSFHLKRISNLGGL